MKENGKDSLLSVIIPCYNEEEGIGLTIQTLTNTMEKANIPYELVLVSDGSKDRTFEIIQKFFEEDPEHIRGIAFSRNFGKESAMLAGMRYARGDCAVVIDSDLQHPPEAIPQMYQLYLNGYDIVEGVKKERQKESLIHRIFASMFYAVFNRAIGMNVKNTSDFKLISRRVINVLLQMPEHERFFRGLTFWTGFSMTTLPYEVQPRRAGESKWSFRKLIHYAMQNIISFSAAPLRFITIIGGIMLLMSFLFAVRALRLYFSGLAAGGATTIVMLILMTGGLILVALSIIGLYIAGIYNEIKARPSYLVDRTVGVDQPGVEEHIDKKEKQQGGVS